MARKTEPAIIQGTTYEITQLGAIEGRKVLARLTNAAAKAGASKMSAVAVSLPEEDLEFLCDTFAKHTLVIGEGVLSRCFNDHFAGRMKAMMEWIEACIELNFRDFLEEKSPQKVPEAQGQ